MQTFARRYHPVKEDVEYVDSIMEISNVGFPLGKCLLMHPTISATVGFCSDFIKEGKAYVDEKSAEEIAHQKG